MDIRFSGKNIALTEGMRDHLRGKLTKLEKYSSKLIESHVVLKKEKYLYDAHVTLLGKNFQASGEGKRKENIMAILETLDIPQVERDRRLRRLLEELDIAYLAKNKAYTLSGGERRRLEITRALVTNPSLILLDEPFSGVDPIAVFEVQKILQKLKAQGLSILLTDHSVRETLSITDRSYLLYEGKVEASGTSQFLVSDPKAREIYLGEKFSLA